MAGFLYFQPGDVAPSRESLAAVGFRLADLAAVPGRECLKGPNDGHGWVFTLGSSVSPEGREPSCLYKPERQQWREAYDGKLWLGWETADPPNRADLQRRAEVDGRAVTMADGREWTVPVLRTRMGETTLPATLGQGPNGTIIQCQVLPEFVELWALVCKLWEAVSVDPTKLSPEDTYQLAAQALGMQYCVTGWELTHLGLFTTDTLAVTLAALVDIPEAALDA
jgi:hypothetical protein